MTKYLSVRNWNVFQHYKDKDGEVVPWIKLHTVLLQNYDFLALSAANQAGLIKVWLLAARTGNRIPQDEAWVARQIGARSIDLDLLVSRGFLEEVYSDSRDALCLTEQNRTEQKKAEEQNGTSMANGSYELPEHELQKLLSALTDKDPKTETTLRRLCARHRLRQADLMVAREAAMSDTARSPSAVAISELKKRGSERQ